MVGPPVCSSLTLLAHGGNVRDGSILLKKSPFQRGAKHSSDLYLRHEMTIQKVGRIDSIRSAPCNKISAADFSTVSVGSRRAANGGGCVKTRQRERGEKFRCVQRDPWILFRLAGDRTDSVLARFGCDETFSHSLGGFRTEGIDPIIADPGRFLPVCFWPVDS